MAKRLPTEVYVRWEEYSNDEDWLVVYEAMEDAATNDGEAVVGVYKLIARKKVRKVLDVKPAR